MAKEGACFQCVELDRFFGAGARDPLAGTARDLDARLAVLRQSREALVVPPPVAVPRATDSTAATPAPGAEAPGEAPPSAVVTAAPTVTDIHNQARRAYTPGR